MTTAYVWCSRGQDLHRFEWFTPDEYRCVDCEPDIDRQDQDGEPADDHR